MNTTTREANRDAKRDVRTLIDRSANDAQLTDREVAALCRRQARNTLLRFQGTAEDDDYGQAYWAVAHHEYLSWEQHYRRQYRAEEAAR